jgi:hypothetical protein
MWSYCPGYISTKQQVTPSGESGHNVRDAQLWYNSITDILTDRAEHCGSSAAISYNQDEVVAV